jgi:hypothetical protein
MKVENSLDMNKNALRKIDPTPFIFLALILQIVSLFFFPIHVLALIFAISIYLYHLLFFGINIGSGGGSGFISGLINIFASAIILGAFFYFLVVIIALTSIILAIIALFNGFLVLPLISLALIAMYVIITWRMSVK